MADSRLSHVDGSGTARMVDVGDKPVTRRRAVARAVVRMQPATGEEIRSQTIRKGDVLTVARIAGIQAAKRTDALIPLCHSLPLETVDIEFTWLDPGSLEIRSTAVTSAKTGVEMEALTAAAVAGLTVYDMAKAMDRAMRIESVELVEKSGGRSGHYVRDPQMQVGDAGATDAT
ncbi:MAG: cyclic pyranopterin monophosphate synthase MoaC [Planctomycetota bacterium]|nr:MAG: cyclic pyranopterin monophosphate synthase MoaC [Planctomycetota bacterium]